MLKCFDWWVIVSHQFPLAGYGTVALANNAAHRIYRSPQSPTTASRWHDEDGYRFRAVVQQKSATTPEGIGEPLGLIRPDYVCHDLNALMKDIRKVYYVSYKLMIYFINGNVSAYV